MRSVAVGRVGDESDDHPPDFRRKVSVRSGEVGDGIFGGTVPLGNVSVFF